MAKQSNATGAGAGAGASIFEALGKIQNGLFKRKVKKYSQ